MYLWKIVIYFNVENSFPKVLASIWCVMCGCGCESSLNILNISHAFLNIDLILHAGISKHPQPSTLQTHCLSQQSLSLLKQCAFSKFSRLERCEQIYVWMCIYSFIIICRTKECVVWEVLFIPSQFTEKKLCTWVKISSSSKSCSLFLPPIHTFISLSFSL